jgi:hypothetical protein
MSKTATAPTTIAELKTEARTKWNRWAIQLADNGTMPAPRDLLDCGIILGHESPADALERDSQIIAAARVRQQEIAAANARIAEWERETGGHEAISRLVAELQGQMERAEALRMGNMMNIQSRGVADRELASLQRQYPELLEGIR